MTAIIAVADNNHYHMLAASQVGVPRREQPGCTHSPATPHLVRIGEGAEDAVSVLGEEVRMALCDVSFALAAHMHFAV
jgi:hypothetical protein